MVRSARCTAPVKAGEVVGRYTIGTRLGTGGMGVVYEARPPDGDSVAIKLLYRETMADAYALRRFRDEATAGAIVHHPNVVTVFERGESASGMPYLVMEHVHGQPLSAHRM